MRSMKRELKRLSPGMIGQRKITVDQIERIIELTLKGKLRPEIAKDPLVQMSEYTVYKYQKEFNLI